MEVSRRTPRSDMTFQQMLTRMGRFLDKLATEMALEPLILDEALTRYARLSTRVVFGEGEVDFALAQATDGEDTILSKFMGYLDTQCIERIDQALREIRETDRPADVALAPDAPPKDAPKN